jgi:hypothetical protein
MMERVRGGGDHLEEEIGLMSTREADLIDERKPGSEDGQPPV